MDVLIRYPVYFLILYPELSGDGFTGAAFGRTISDKATECVSLFSSDDESMEFASKFGMDNATAIACHNTKQLAGTLENARDRCKFENAAIPVGDGEDIYCLPISDFIDDLRSQEPA